MMIYWRPGRQRGLRELYRGFIAPGDVVFDVGAHLGDRTRAFAALGARVVALEPQPQLLPWLHLWAGRLPGVTLVAQAVGAVPGEAQLAVSRRNPTVSSLSEAWRQGVQERQEGFRGVRWDGDVRVGVTTLDLLVEEFGIPSFCKIDVEGFEEEVLKGLSQAIPALSVEFVAGDLRGALACVRRMEALGPYEFNVIPGEERSFLLPDWTPPSVMKAWLESGAGGFPSGDLYARLRRGSGPAR
ncbi:MAG: FkbM family methyltransferase [Gemmatimonadota bacterium]